MMSSHFTWVSIISKKCATVDPANERDAGQILIRANFMRDCDHNQQTCDLFEQLAASAKQ